jgi:integrase
MARKLRHSALESRSARLKLPLRLKPHTGPTLARGIQLLYRRNKSNGSWVVKAANGSGGYWTKAFAVADDYEDSDGKNVLTFYEAQDAAKALARGGDAASSDTAPVTVDQALTAYAADLRSRNAREYNAQWPRFHLTSTLLAKPVALLTSKELTKWRDSLLEKIGPASVNRLMNSLCAALELAAQHDEQRISNRSAWEIGLAGLPDAQVPRNVVISDAQVSAFVAAAYARDPALGLLMDVLAVTGTRPSQAIRLRVDDLHHTGKPKLMMPKSGKGGGRNRAQKKAQRYSVPITAQLAQKLKAASKGRPGHAPLLLQADGSGWGSDAAVKYRHSVVSVVKSIGLGPEVTAYSLRHSSVVRMLLKNVPVRLIASLHDTSISQIERNYSAHIAEYGSDHARDALLEHAPPAVGNVVSLVR